MDRNIVYMCKSIRISLLSTNEDSFVTIIKF